jgi:hypothetical protein
VSDYFILQTNNESAAYAFKVRQDRWSPAPRKVQRIQSTVTGKLDVQAAAHENSWTYGIKFSGTESGNFAITPGAILTASSVSWGTLANLLTLWRTDAPPNNKLRFRDFDGTESYVYFDGDLRRELQGVTTDGAQVAVVTMRGSA